MGEVEGQRGGEEKREGQLSYVYIYIYTYDYRERHVSTVVRKEFREEPAHAYMNWIHGYRQNDGICYRCTYSIDEEHAGGGIIHYSLSPMFSSSAVLTLSP